MIETHGMTIGEGTKIMTAKIAIVEVVQEIRSIKIDITLIAEIDMMIGINMKGKINQKLFANNT